MNMEETQSARYLKVCNLFTESIYAELNKTLIHFKYPPKNLHLNNCLEYNDKFNYISEYIEKIATRKLLYDDLSDIGKDILTNYISYYKQWTKLNNKYKKELDELTETTKENNGKYFILTQFTKDEEGK